MLGNRENELLAECGKTPLNRHSREGGSPEGFEKTGFRVKPGMTSKENGFVTRCTG